MQLHTPRKLIPITRSQSSRVLSAVGGDAGHDTGIVERGVETAELVNRPVDHRRHFGVVTHVTTDGERLVTGGDQLLLPPPSPRPL